jgi:flagellar biosynthetic protein FlhB
MAAGSTGERTERPTGRRVKEATERGQVARSRDLSAVLSLGAATITLAWFGARMFGLLRDRMITILGTIGDQARGGIDATDLTTALWADGETFMRVLAPVLVVAAAVSILTSIVQTGWSYSPKAVELNWGRLNPASGFARFAPLQAGPDLAKALIGLAVIGSLSYLFLRASYTDAPRLTAMMPAEAASFAWERMWSLLWRSSLALAALAGADYGLQKWRWLEQLKMTRQEVRDDQKMTEGNPEIKARVRRVQRDMTRRRMLNDVKRATVVITNPTHVAVALEYRREAMAAPVVLAKGVDELAARIRAVAREHGVPLVENVTLARALHKGAEVGDVIPAELFGAVAEVLAYLVRLKQLVL